MEEKETGFNKKIHGDNGDSLNPLVKEQARGWIATIQMEDLEEKQRVEFLRWLNFSPENKKAFKYIYALWNDIAETPRLPEIIDRALPDKQINDSKANHWLWLGSSSIAAMLILTAVIAYNYLFYTPESSSIIGAAGHENTQVTLADGSSVTLSGKSEITTRFTHSKREIELVNGSVYFEVIHDDKKPFLVRVDDATVRVHGTKFEVRRSSRDTRVSVTEGKVSVKHRHKPNPRFVAEGGQITVDEKGVFSSGVAFDKNVSLSWLNGRLSYEGEEFGEIVQDINRYRHKKIYIRDKRVEKIRLTTSFSIEQIDQALKAIVATQPISMIESANKVIISYK